MKTQLIQALHTDDKAAVFSMFLNPTNYMLLHDTLIEECTVEVCYYYVKALKLASQDICFAFAAASIGSVHGDKQLFHNVLTLYGVPPHNLEYNHTEANGTQPTLTIYCNIARSIL